MASAKRRTEIRIETHEIDIIRFSTCRSVRCERCGIEVPGCSPQEAAAILTVDVAAVESCMRMGRFHLVGDKGIGLLCARSFLSLLGAD